MRPPFDDEWMKFWPSNFLLTHSVPKFPSINDEFWQLRQFALVSNVQHFAIFLQVCSFCDWEVGSHSNIYISIPAVFCNEFRHSVLGVTEQRKVGGLCSTKGWPHHLDRLLYSSILSLSQEWIILGKEGFQNNLIWQLIHYTENEFLRTTQHYGASLTLIWLLTLFWCGDAGQVAEGKILHKESLQRLISTVIVNCWLSAPLSSPLSLCFDSFNAITQEWGEEDRGGDRSERLQCKRRHWFRADIFLWKLVVRRYRKSKSSSIC